MSTTSTIGTASRNYSTITAWKAAFATGGWIGECYNDTEFTGETFPITFSMASSVTDFVTLRCATGQAFKDNANVQTNALKYTAANGVAVKSATNYAVVVDVRSDYVTIQNIQFKCTAVTSGTYGLVQSTNSVPHSVYDGCLLDMDYCHTSKPLFAGKGGLFKNCMGIARQVAIAAANEGFADDYTACTFANCAAVRTSQNAPAGTAIGGTSGATVTLNNCAWFGFSSEKIGPVAGQNNCSDLAISFGTGNQQSKSFALQYVATASAGSDFRVKSGADLIDNGFTDTTDIPAAIDIVGTSRPQGSAWDIGCWEYKSSGNVYNVSVTESASAADTVSSSLNAASAVNDNNPATDAYTSLVNSLNAVADALAAADTVSSSAVFPRTVAEVLTATDIYASQAIRPASIAEAGTAADTVSSLVSSANVIGEALTATDSYNAGGGNIYNVSVSEAGAAADLVSSSAIFPRAVADALTATDAYGGQINAANLVVEALTATDTYSAKGIFSASLSDALAATDIRSCVVQLNLFIIEAATAVDAYDANAVVPRATKCNTLSGAPRIRRLEGPARVRKLGGQACD